MGMQNGPMVENNGFPRAMSIYQRVTQRVTLTFLASKNVLESRASTLRNLYLVVSRNIPYIAILYIFFMYWICWQLRHGPSWGSGSSGRPAVGPVAWQKRHRKAGGLERPSQASWEQLGTAGKVPGN